MSAEYWTRIAADQLASLDYHLEHFWQRDCDWISAAGMWNDICRSIERWTLYQRTAEEEIGRRNVALRAGFVDQCLTEEVRRGTIEPGAALDLMASSLPIMHKENLTYHEGAKLARIYLSIGTPKEAP